MSQNFDNICNNCSKIGQANRRYQYLLSCFTHEIRNPLTLIYSSLQLIEKRCPELSDLLLWTQVQEDMRSTIHLLRDLSHPEDRSNSHLRPILLSPLLDKIAVSCHAFMAEQGVLLTSEIDSGLPAIPGNEVKLKEAVINLLLNACDAAANHSIATRKFVTADAGTHIASENAPSANAAPCLTAPKCSVTSHEKQQGHVLLRACLYQQQIHIHVRDNGPGIPLRDRESVFEPFITHKAAGTGLGLSIIREVALQHHGTLTLETSTAASDSYTDFCLSLPVLSDAN